MTTISTHVLDTSLGKPAAGIDVRLFQPDGIVISSGVTNADGRVASLVPDGTSIERGDYRLTFAIGSYFMASGRQAFYPTVTIDFTVGDTTQHYHVPLLLSPFGYSTYRGS